MSLTLANTRCSLLALLLPSIPITLLNVPTMTLATPPSQGPGRSGQTWKGIRAEHTSTRPDIWGHAHRYKSGHWEMLLFCTTLCCQKYSSSIPALSYYKIYNNDYCELFQVLEYRNREQPTLVDSLRKWVLHEVMNLSFKDTGK